MASDRPARRGIPPRTKLAATLIRVGMAPEIAVWLSGRVPWAAVGRVLLESLLLDLGIEDAEFDHDPPLGLRAVNAAGDDYDPPQLDPKHIVPRRKVDHRTKTSGTPPGQKVVHVADGDQHKIAKAARLEAKRLADEGLARLRNAAEEAGADMPKGWPRSSFPKGRKMQSRPFPKRARP